MVEKILAEHEALRGDWPIDGTTGYEVANLLLGLLIDPRAEIPLTRVYADFVGRGIGLRQDPARMQETHHGQ